MYKGQICSLGNTCSPSMSSRIMSDNGRVMKVAIVRYLDDFVEVVGEYDHDRDAFKEAFKERQAARTR